MKILLFFLTSYLGWNSLHAGPQNISIDDFVLFSAKESEVAYETSQYPSLSDIVSLTSLLRENENFIFERGEKVVEEAMTHASALSRRLERIGENELEKYHRAQTFYFNLATLIRSVPKEIYRDEIYSNSYYRLIGLIDYLKSLIESNHPDLAQKWPHLSRDIYHYAEVLFAGLSYAPWQLERALNALRERVAYAKSSQSFGLRFPMVTRSECKRASGVPYFTSQATLFRLRPANIGSVRDPGYLDFFLDAQLIGQLMAKPHTVTCSLIDGKSVSYNPEKAEIKLRANTVTYPIPGLFIPVPGKSWPTQEEIVQAILESSSKGTTPSQKLERESESSFPLHPEDRW